MPKFDTDVQELKYRVLKEVARATYDGTLLEEYNEIPKKISPGPDSNMRCCIYKERAIVADRIKLEEAVNKAEIIKRRMIERGDSLENINKRLWLRSFS